MKKLIYVFALSLATAPLHAAASTCETRVDKNLDKSTRQKVEFCLTEEPEPEAEAAKEVILSDTYSVQYPKPKEPQAAPTQQVIKKYTAGPVSQEYLDRDDYPAFRNDSLPRLSDEEAHETALEALHQQAAPAQPAKAKKPARKKASKPARKKTQPAPAPAAAAPEAALPQQQQQPQQPVVPTQTPAAELEQAQALQNDPLYTNYTDNGATPQGFSDNGIYQDDFGYNATDPALQP